MTLTTRKNIKNCNPNFNCLRKGPEWDKFGNRPNKRSKYLIDQNTKKLLTKELNNYLCGFRSLRYCSCLRSGSLLLKDV